MTELSFLIDLLMNHKFPKATKELIAARIKEVEAKINVSYAVPIAGTLPYRTNTLVNGAPQAASTVAALAKHGLAQTEPIEAPVEQIAQTAATAAAMASRKQAIANRNNIPDPLTGRARKF